MSLMNLGRFVIISISYKCYPIHLLCLLSVKLPIHLLTDSVDIRYLHIRALGCNVL